MIKRSLCSAVFLVVVFICLIAMVCPSQTMARFVPQGTVISSFSPKDVISTSGAEISDDGEVKKTGPNPNIYLGEINRSVRTIALNFKEPVSQSFSAIMYYDTGSGLNESEKVYSSAFKGDEWVVFTLPEIISCKAARLDIDVSYKFNSVNLYEEEPDVVLSEMTHPWWKYVICALISTAVFVLFFLLDIKLNFCSKICETLKKNYKFILIGFIALIISVLLSIVIELLCGILWGASSSGEIFNIYRFVLICGVVLSVTALVIFARTTDKKPENLFLVILLITGIVMIFASPFGHISWDSETHYQYALKSSYIGTSYKTQADRYIISNQDLYWQKDNAFDDKKNIELLNNSHDYIIEEFDSYRTIAHIPSGIFIALARLFGFNFYWTHNIGILSNLLIYAFACYFGMKKLKSGKMILAVLAFLPTNLFLATNYSYDYWVNALSMLGISYFVSEMQQPEKQISLKDNIIMCGSLALAVMPKQIYAVLLLIPLFLIKNNFQKRKRYYTVCVLAFVVLFVMLAARSLTAVASSGDLRGGSAVNPPQQIHFILSQPFTYAKTLIKFLWSYLSIGSVKEYICNMAYMGYGVGYNVMLLLMLVTAFTDKNEYDLNNKYLLLKGFNLLLLIGMAALMATALYIDFTPVGSDYISGCQSRYLAPLLLPVLAVIGSGYIKNTVNRKIYNTSIISCCGIVNFATIISTMT